MTDQKPIFVRVPKDEYVRFKIFTAFHQISMQDLVRRSVKYYIEACKREMNEKNEQQEG